MKRLFCVFLLFCFWGNVLYAKGENKTFPYKKTIEIVAPANPGGGWDSTARALKKVIDDNNLIPGINVIVTNKPGANGSIAWNDLIKRKDPHVVAMSSAYVYLNPLLGVIEGAPTPETLHPVATLTTEWIGAFVKADSPYQTVNELFEVVKNDPRALNFAVAPGRGNNDHLATLTVARNLGVDVTEFDKNITSTDTSELLPGVIGGFYDAVFTGVQEGIPFVESGDLRILVTTADKRYEGKYSYVPTLRDEGIDLVFPHWRGMVSGEMNEEETAWWDTLISAAVKTADWQKILANNQWIDYYLSSQQTKELWDEQYKSYGELVSAAGLAVKN